MDQIAATAASKSIVTDTLNRIALLQSAGLQDESRVLCEWVISHDIDNPLAYYFLASSDLSFNRIDSAVDNLDRALALEPNNGEFLHLYAVCLRMVGEYDKAVEIACAALRKTAARYDTWNLLAECLLKLGELDGSEKAIRQAIELDPQREDAFITLSLLATELSSHARAEEILDHAIALCTTPPMHLRVRRLSAALKADNTAYIDTYLDSAIEDAREKSDLLELIRIKAWVLYYDGQSLEAISLLKRAMDNYPDSDFKGLLAMCLSEVGRNDEAIALYEGMLQSRPGHDGLRFNLSLAQLAVGRVMEGLMNYEARWRGSALIAAQRTFAQPAWRGEACAGKRLLLWGEQGIGDQIRFVSMVDEVRDLGCDITIECNTKLVELFKASFPSTVVRPLGPRDCDRTGDYECFDLHCPLGSIPQYFRRNVYDFVRNRRPWLVRDRNREDHYKELLKRSPNDILIGLCWRSGRLTSRRQMSYLTVECFRELATIPNSRFVALQYDLYPFEIEAARSVGLNMVVVEGIDQKDDLLSASHLIGACDIIISAATSVADIAGAMGKAVMMFGPQRAWPLLGQSYNPWYPNVQYIPIERGDPEAVARRICRDWESILGSISAD